MKAFERLRISEWGILFLLAFCILWKGGKSLEATWLLSAFAGCITIGYWTMKNFRRRDKGQLQDAKNGLSTSRPEVPYFLWLCALLYIFLTVVSFAFSTTRNYGLDEVLRTASFMFVFLWIARMTAEDDTEKLLKLCTKVITAAVIVAAVIGIAVYIFQPVNRFVGTFFDYRFHTDYWPNAWGQFVLLAWPLVLLEALRSKKSIVTWLLMGALGLVLGSLLLSYSRGSMIAFAGQIVVLLLLYSMIASRDVRYRRIFKQLVRVTVIQSLAVTVIAVGVFLSVNALRSYSFDVQSVSEKVTFTASEGVSSISERSQFWNQATTLFQERPLSGWGPYSFRFVQPRLMQDVLATSDHPHNAALKLAMELGIFAAAIYFVIIGYVLINSIRSLFTKRRAHSHERDAVHIIILASLIGVLAHNMIDYNLQFVGIGLAFWMYVGFLVEPVSADSNNVADSFRRWRFGKTLSRVDTLFALLLLVVVLWEGHFLLFSSFGRHAEARGDSDNALVWYSRSRDSYFTRDMYLSEALLYMSRQRNDESLQALDRYQSQNAEDPRFWKIRGMLALRMKDDKIADQALDRAYLYGKYTDLGIVQLYADNLRKKKTPGELLSHKLEFDALFSEYADAIERNAHFIALSQNVEELLALSRSLAAMYPLDGQRYKSIARKASAHARAERENYDSRMSGILW